MRQRPESAALVVGVSSGMAAAYNLVSFALTARTSSVTNAILGSVLKVALLPCPPHPSLPSPSLFPPNASLKVRAEGGAPSLLPSFPSLLTVVSPGAHVLLIVASLHLRRSRLSPSPPPSKVATRHSTGWRPPSSAAPVPQRGSKLHFTWAELPARLQITRRVTRSVPLSVPSVPSFGPFSTLCAHRQSVCT